MRYAVKLEFEASDTVAGQMVLNKVQEILTHMNVSPKIESLEASAQDFVVIHTDGGCDGKKGGVGAWAFVAHFPDGLVIEETSGMMETTNNRMEMMAVIKALEAIEIGRPLRLISDSEYVVKGINSWCRNWVRNGWKNSQGKPVVNQDLWRHLLMLYQLHDVRLEWTKGHAGNAHNERADMLCTATMINLHKAFLAGEDVEYDNAPQLQEKLRNGG